MKTQNIKGKLLSNQIATRNTKEKKAGRVELARKLDADVRVTDFRVLFAAYLAHVQGPCKPAQIQTHVLYILLSRPFVHSL